MIVLASTGILTKTDPASTQKLTAVRVYEAWATPRAAVQAGEISEGPSVAGGAGPCVSASSMAKRAATRAPTSAQEFVGRGATILWTSRSLHRLVWTMAQALRGGP